MLTVSLLRHAKSSWANPTLKDFDRLLAGRGRRAAPRMGAHMAAAGLMPDLILCSSAARARETLDLLLGELGPGPLVRYDEALYHASANTMLATLRGLPADCRHVMIVGHNPGLHGLALDLFRDGPKAAKTAIAQKFPTAALAVISFETKDWSRIEVGAGRLLRFVTPKDMGG